MNDDLVGVVGDTDDEDEVVGVVVAEDILDGLADVDPADEDDTDDFGGALEADGSEEEKGAWGMD